MDSKRATETRVDSAAAGRTISESELEKGGKSKNRLSMTAPIMRHGRGQSSGTFLLDAVFPTSSLSRSAPTSMKTKKRSSAILQPDYSESSTNTGKHYAEYETISLPKRRSLRSPWHRRRESSLGSSPLGKAVVNVNATPSLGEEVPVEPVDGDIQIPSNSTSTDPLPTMRTTLPGVGLDTDPAQIVNLALTLSDSRRRRYGGNRAHSSTLPGGGNRIVSRSPRIGYTAGLSQQSHPILAKPGTYMPQQVVVPSPLGPSVPASKTGIAPVLGLNAGTLDHDERTYYNFSDATILRANKARRHFELFWEYMRLLPYLPSLHPPSPPYFNPLPRPHRAYNPLQVIRNRKVRFRERSPIDIEAEGWDDLTKVHQWLEAIASEKRRSIQSSNADVKLPPFHTHRNGHGMISSVSIDGHLFSPSPSRKSDTNIAGTKPARQRFDWSFSPAELLADAAWVEEGNNKSKITDRDGNQLFFNYRASEAGNGHVHRQGTHPEGTEDSFDRPVTPRNSLLSDSAHSRVPNGHSKNDSGLNHALHLASPDTQNMKSEYQHDASSGMSHRESMSDNDPRGRSRTTNRDENYRKDKAELELNKTSQSQLPELSIPKRHAKQSGPFSPDNTPLSPSRFPLATGRKLFHDLKTEIAKRPMSPTSDDARLSLEEPDSTAPNSPIQGPVFPSITVNLSPPSSREPSPRRGNLPRVIGSFHERSRSKRRDRRAYSLDESSPERALLHKKSAVRSPDKVLQTKTLEPSPIPESPPTETERQLYNSSAEADSHAPKLTTPQDSKLRNILKGGRIAEIVGNEVSRVGDKIRRRDGLAHSRQSSSTPSLASENHESDDDRYGASQRTSQKPHSNRLATATSDYFSLQFPGDNERVPRNFTTNLPHFTSTIRQDESTYTPASAGAGSINNSQGRASLENGRSSMDGDPRWIGKFDLSEKLPSSPSVSGTNGSNSDQRNSCEFYPVVEISKAENGARKSRLDEHKPVTGLRGVDATVHPKRPPPMNSRSSWAISNRSIPTLKDNDLAEKREIHRVKALLYSSGIKAREICRRAENARDHPTFVSGSQVNPNQHLPPLRFLEMFEHAGHSSIRQFENDSSNLEHSVNELRLSTSLFQDLKSLENLVNQSLTPRVRAAAIEAENLSTQLNTTSTLTIKQLSDALVQGIRKRNRRLRLARRVGFVLLEWAVVGVMWWVWLIVMTFKLIRSICRGAVTSVRWILWL